MTWTYDVSDLATSQKDQVRLMIGDTYSGDPQMQDEEILFWITQRSSIIGAAAECCRVLATKFSRSVDQAAGDTKAAYSQMAKAYAVRATMFDARAATSGAAGAGAAYAGGISLADKINRELDQDRVDPQFNVGMMDDWLPVPPVGNETLDGGGSGSDPNR